MSGVAVILFLGGWHTGLAPIDNWLVATRNAPTEGFSLVGYFANLVGLVVFVKKAGFLVFVQIWLRWTLPRLRIDQVMMTCLKYLLPISCVLLLGIVLWPFALNATLGRSTLLESAPALGDLNPDVVRSLAQSEDGESAVPAVEDATEDYESSPESDSEKTDGPDQTAEASSGTRKGRS